MELKEYLKIIQKNFGLILSTAILVALFVYFLTAKQSTVYEANGSLTIVSKPNVELKNVYEYDGYYALQSAVLFGSTIAAWLASPDNVAEIHQRAGYKIEEGQTTKALSKLIKTTLLTNSFSANFQLKGSEKEKVQKLAQATSGLIQAKTEEFNQKAGTKVRFEIALSEPTITEAKPQKGFNALIGFFAGLVLGIFLTFIKGYLK